MSNESRFSIITIGPYEDELYSAFGHSGIRYYNKSTGEDVFYNYGIFDFDQPNFSLNFLNGQLLYKVGKYSYPSAEKFYRSQDRYIKEQILNLNSLIAVNQDSYSRCGFHPLTLFTFLKNRFGFKDFGIDIFSFLRITKRDALQLCFPSSFRIS